MGHLLSVKDLEVAFFSKDGKVSAVNSISYTVDEGDTLGIVGESGCGKSVSAMALLRLLPTPPARIMGGEVVLQGQDLLKLPQSQMHTIRGSKIAMIFQDPMTSLNPVMTVGKQSSEAVRVNLGLGARECRDRTIEVLSNVGIPRAVERLGDYPHQFSGGMRQRVMIAMAISCRPKLLIADEPTTSLDVTIQAQIVDLVRRLQQDLGMAVIWITHDLGVIARIAKRLNVMYAGKIIEYGPIKSVFGKPQHPYTMGLLGSLPRMDASSDQELQFIEGAPPDMVRLPKGCAFAPRCKFRSERCLVEEPQLVAVGDDHMAACIRLPEIHAQ